MSIESILQPLSLFFEVLVLLLGIGLAVARKKVYGWGIALTFGLYVIYDATRFFSIPLPPDILGIIFFVASLSILWAVWTLWKEGSSGGLSP